MTGFLTLVDFMQAVVGRAHGSVGVGAKPPGLGSGGFDTFLKITTSSVVVGKRRL